MEIITDEKLFQYIKEYCGGEEYEPVCAYGAIHTSYLDVMVFGAFASFMHKHIAVGFNDKNLIVVNLDSLGKPYNHCIIGYKKIVSVDITQGLFGIGKTIKINIFGGSRLTFTLNKYVVGLKQQKENIKIICKILDTCAKK